MNIPLSTEQQELTEKLLKETGSGKYKAVSFRMSGTLVVYPFAQPEDLFAFMEEDFRDLSDGKQTFTDVRTAAQDEAEKKNSGKGTVPVEEIYDVIMKRTKLSFEDCKKLMDRECELAVYFAMPRELGKKLFSEASRKKKRILIVADTIYPRNITENILKRCGYSCGNILETREVSCGLSQNEGVFEAILEKCHVTPDKLLNIGGNVEADVELPIMKGAKALLVTNCNQLMVKSGRLRGYVQAKIVLDSDPTVHLALRCAMGLCSVKLFDVPRNKKALSDFCGDPYTIGFTVWGCSQLTEDHRTDSPILSALPESPEVKAGAEDFIRAFGEVFGDHLVRHGFKDCDLPLIFLENHSAPGDRQLFTEIMSADDIQRWADSTTEPDMAPVTEHKQKRNAAAKFADKLFPPGTKVRNIADGMLVKLKSKAKL